MELVFFKQLEASYFLQAPTSDFGVAKIKWRVIDILILSFVVFGFL